MLLLPRHAGEWQHGKFCELGRHLRAGDLLVLNDTRVLPARLRGVWQDSGGAVELLLLEQLSGADLQEGEWRWEALCGSGRKARPGLVALFGGGSLAAEIVTAAAPDGSVRLILRGAGELRELLERFGETPLPPYIERRLQTEDGKAADKERYQTIFACEGGAVAAPTAGLHFTHEIIAELKERGVEFATITLHVGLGTFKPIKAERLEEHQMHAERYCISAQSALAINNCRQRGGRVIAVGSTSVRTLESMAAANNGQAVACAGRSQLFIYPPYKFSMIDGMLTNFHLPRSTLLAMVAALTGRERLLCAYQAAIEARYRFYSYGDCMLIL